MQQDREHLLHALRPYHGRSGENRKGRNEANERGWDQVSENMGQCL